ncbi:TonB-dependent receptor [Rhizorhabdus wittichii RW1]|jgi:outer membrane receptor protein involved in Fe transport|uniref:TonB-dependent receptor n=1 Tax=Rhizorhabdus wittichii (strain DSM 6014 / CCUG 31198 / JCM 15750 / NBRC 105917 / EY 4224 / RW1) TaxID=392499 RepID=A0A9J9HF13_RHIWR|nr:TonB-dependent receptor [Rhizorhabdus wittichii]ABQ70571.1 TonB-dependent receptor [Rhizorhabdus wittichii RW1]
MKKKSIQGASLAAVLAGVLLQAPAWAADREADAAADSGEIIVTAQKRAEPLQKVPVSAAVVSGITLQKQGVGSIQDAMQHVPAVYVSQAGPANLLFIRGVGSGDNNPLFEQSVATFVDGIYRGRSRSTQSSFLDIERVEVLKGPQSVYFGNNSIAGVFNIATRNPGDHWEGYVRGLYNFNFDNATIEGAVGGPVTDTLGIRVAGLVQRGDGWLLDKSSGIHIPRVRNYAGRVTLLWKPTDRLSVNLKAHAERGRQKGGLAAKLTSCPPLPIFTNVNFGCTAAIAAGDDTRPNYVRTQNPDQGIDFDAQSAISTISYEADPFTLTSVTGYYHHKYNLKLDVDAASPDLANFTVPERFSQFSQEFRVASNGTGPFDYMFGAYYEHDKLRGQIYANYGLFSPILPGLVPPLAPYLPFGQADDFRQTSDIYGLFASVVVRPTDKLDVTLAARQSWVDKHFGINQYFGMATQPFGPIVPLPAALAPIAAAVGKQLGLGVAGYRAENRSDAHFSPSITVGYDFTPEIRGYAKYVNGFKAGGYNGLEHTGLPGTLSFGPEYVDSYEVGLKTQWFNRRLTFNIAAFRSDFEGLQQSAIGTNGVQGGIFPVVRNAKGARSQGIETDMAWRVNEHWNTSLSLTWLDSKFTDFKNAGGSPTDIALGHPTIDLSGKRGRYAPELSGNFNVEYMFDVGPSLQVRLRPEAMFTTRYNISPNNDPLLWQEGFVKLGATVSVANPSQGWEFSVIGKNLTDRRIMNFEAGSNGSYIIGTEEPWSISAQLRYNF